jgi:hypothetical protein
VLRRRRCLRPAPHKDFSDCNEKEGGKGESASEAHRQIGVQYSGWIPAEVW